jgi:hypothetical protein
VAIIVAVVVSIVGAGGLLALVMCFKRRERTGLPFKTPVKTAKKARFSESRKAEPLADHWFEIDETPKPLPEVSPAALSSDEERPTRAEGLLRVAEESPQVTRGDSVLKVAREEELFGKAGSKDEPRSSSRRASLDESDEDAPLPRRSRSSKKGDSQKRRSRKAEEDEDEPAKPKGPSGKDRLKTRKEALKALASMPEADVVAEASSASKERKKKRAKSRDRDPDERPVNLEEALFKKVSKPAKTKQRTDDSDML